jgi:hypothetical protein
MAEGVPLERTMDLYEYQIILSNEMALTLSGGPVPAIPYGKYLPKRPSDHAVAEARTGFAQLPRQRLSLWTILIEFPSHYKTETESLPPPQQRLAVLILTNQIPVQGVPILEV